MSTKVLYRFTSNKSIFTCIISCRCCCYYYIVCIIGWVFHMVAPTLNNFLGRTNLNEKRCQQKFFLQVEYKLSPLTFKTLLYIMLSQIISKPNVYRQSGHVFYRQFTNRGPLSLLSSTTPTTTTTTPPPPPPPSPPRSSSSVQPTSSTSSSIATSIFLQQQHQLVLLPHQHFSKPNHYQPILLLNLYHKKKLG